MKTFIFQGMVQFDSEDRQPTICGDRVKWLEVIEFKSLFYNIAESKAWKYFFKNYPEYKDFIQLV